jgi:aspartate/methionine/tyrosine aminotransferase
MDRIGDYGGGDSGLLFLAMVEARIMSDTGRAKSSVYIEWAKTRSMARFSLATSGIFNYPLSDLPVKIEDLEVSGPSLYGYGPLQRSLALKCQVPPYNVVAAIGTSMANHLAMAAMIEPGDEVLIERPAYEPLLAIASYLGAEIKRFERRFEDGFTLDPEEVSRKISPRTRLVVMTNLHNPTGALTANDAISRIGEIALAVGARVLVDEVYLEAAYESAPRSAFHLGKNFIVTSSLTKAYGLSGLRCGWVVAASELAERMWKLNDLFGVIPAHAAERLSVIALKNIEQIAERAKQLLETNRELINRFLDSREELEVVRPQFGTVLFPRLLRGNVDDLCNLLREKYETSVVPGRFFEMPDHFRIGIGCETETLVGGLERLGAALDEMDRVRAS